MFENGKRYSVWSLSTLEVMFVRDLRYAQNWYTGKRFRVKRKWFCEVPDTVDSKGGRWFDQGEIVTVDSVTVSHFNRRPVLLHFTSDSGVYGTESVENSCTMCEASEIEGIATSRITWTLDPIE